MEREQSFPIYATKGGGLVRAGEGNTYIFIQKPNCPGLNVGDVMPRGWDIAPANRLAQEEVMREACASQIKKQKDPNLKDLGLFIFKMLFV